MIKEITTFFFYEVDNLVISYDILAEIDKSAASGTHRVKYLNKCNQLLSKPSNVEYWLNNNSY